MSSTPTQPRLDPSQLPQPPLFTHPGPIPTTYHPQQSLGIPPPPAGSRTTNVDHGNASPRFLRSTLYALPQDRSLWHDAGDLPWGILATPLAAPSMDFSTVRQREPWNSTTSTCYRDPEAVPVVRLSASPPRCPTCWVYANPGWKNNTTSGRSSSSSNTCWGCGNRLGGTEGGVPLQFGTVEYAWDDPAAAAAYCTRSTPVQPVHVYAIDLTTASPKGDALQQQLVSVLSKVGQALADHWDRQRQYHMNTSTTIVAPRIGVCFFSGLGIVVRNRRDDRYMICADLVQEPFCGIPLDQWTFDVQTEMDDWHVLVRDHLPTELPAWWTATVQARVGSLDGLEVACGGAALAFLADALAVTGGRGTLLTHQAPRYGVGRIPGRSSEGPVQQCVGESASEEEKAAAKFYKDLAERCASARVALSVAFLQQEETGTRTLELATLSELCRTTCGNLILIPPTPDWTETLREELCREALCFAGWDAVLKVRCSKGISVKSFLCPVGVPIDTLTDRELELSCVSHRTSIAVELEHRVGGISGQHAFIQTALLYTNIAGQRRLRVSTLGVMVGSTVPDIFRYADFGALSCFLAREAVQCLRTPDTTDPKKRARNVIFHKGTIHPLASYRRMTSSSSGQLLLPDQLQLLPLYSMGLLKSPLVAPNVRGMPSRITADDRAYYAWLVSQAGPAHTLLLAYPTVFEVNSETNIEWVPPEEPGGITGCAQLPTPVVPSMQSLQDDKIYIIDNGIRIHLYCGPQVPAATAEALTNAPQQPHHPQVPHIQRAIAGIVDQLRLYSSTTADDLRPTSAPLVRSDSSTLYRLMVADATTAEKDYADFLCTMHQQVRENSVKK